MKFTDRAINALCPKTSDYDVTEADGFTIRVYKSGKKSFCYIYSDHGKRRRASIGPYPSLSLADARKRHREMYDRHKQGLPLDGKDDCTLKELAQEYLINHAKPKKKSWREDGRILNRDILPILGRRKAKSIRRGDVTKLLGDLPGTSANNAFKILRRVYSWAIGMDQYGLEASPCFGLSQPQPDTKKTRYLTAEEIRTFWWGIEDTRMSRVVVCALRMILVTGQRPSEVSELPMSEIDREWWNLPKERAKNGQEHRTYLTPLALSCLCPTERKWAFSHGKRPLPHTRLSQSLKRFREGRGRWLFPDFTPHDLRRTCATYLAELGFSDEVIGAVLNHKKQTVTGIYNRYRYDREKKTALLAWEGRLLEIIHSGTV